MLTNEPAQVAAMPPSIPQGVPGSDTEGTPSQPNDPGYEWDIVDEWGGAVGSGQRPTGELVIGKFGASLDLDLLAQTESVFGQ